MEHIIITNTISEFKFSNIPKIFITSDGIVNDPKEYISDTEEFNGEAHLKTDAIQTMTLMINHLLMPHRRSVMSKDTRN